MSTRFALACSALAAVVLAGAAGDRPSDNPAPVWAQSASTTVSRTAVAPSSELERAEPDCNPRASLRPQGTLPESGQMPAGSTMARIAQRGYLVAGVNQYSSQFALRDENLQLEGFEIDIVRDIAESIFGDRERVVFWPLDLADRFSTAASGEIDLLVATATITCRRRETVEFSAVYYEAGQRVLVNRGSMVKGVSDLGDKRVCAGRGSTSLREILRATPKPIAVGVPITTDCLMLLQLGEVDAVSTDDTLLAGQVAEDPQTQIVGPRFTEEPYGIAINKGTPDLVRFVNAVLERRAADGRWRASYERWLTALGPPPSPPAPQYRD
jgi:polar amino acid transport system substrate-binding protein